MQASAAPDFETKLSESYKAMPDGDCRLAEFVVSLVLPHVSPLAIY